MIIQINDHVVSRSLKWQKFFWRIYVMKQCKL